MHDWLFIFASLGWESAHRTTQGGRVGMDLNEGEPEVSKTVSLSDHQKNRLEHFV
ncbi:MAG: hypothetical protein HQL15_05470 [Candidatus Omnitrophica bacterium]|nr:hypothetical protein [Candidatus Omnitrophota bacterium]